jgi:hypothetical protein
MICVIVHPKILRSLGPLDPWALYYFGGSRSCSSSQLPNVTQGDPWLPTEVVKMRSRQRSVAKRASRLGGNLWKLGGKTYGNRRNLWLF